MILCKKYNIDTGKLVSSNSKINKIRFRFDKNVRF